MSNYDASRNKAMRLTAIGAMSLLFPVLVLAQNYVFGPNVRVNDDSPGSAFHSTYSPGEHCIAVRGDTVYLVWRDDRGGWSHIYFARSNDAGQSFLPNVRVDNMPSGCAGIIPSLAVDENGGIHVSFLNYNVNDRAFIYYARSTNGGASFNPPVRACDSVMDHQYGFSSVAVSHTGQRVYVVRSQLSDSLAQSTWLFLSRSTDGGSTFLPDVRVLDDTAFYLLFENPSVAVFEDSIVLVAGDTHTFPSGGRGLICARSTDGGSTFVRGELMLDTLRAGSPSVAIDSQGRVFVYQGANWLAISSDTGRTFRQQRILTRAGFSLWAAPDGRLWFGGIVGNGNCCCIHSPDAGLTFWPPVRPSDEPPGNWEFDPTIAANRQGVAFVAWDDYRNDPTRTYNDIYFATGTVAAIAEQHETPLPGVLCEVLSNPAHGSVAVEYSSTHWGSVRLEVRDIAGREVAVIEQTEKAPGRCRFNWDGRDAHGREAASGIYLLRVGAGATAVARKVVLLNR